MNRKATVEAIKNAKEVVKTAMETINSFDGEGTEQIQALMSRFLRAKTKEEKDQIIKEVDKLKDQLK